MVNYTEDIKKRIRNPKYLNLITTADEAAKYIEDGMVIGMSGFTPSDYPKLIPLALIERKKAGEDIKVDVYAGATLGQEVDVKMVQEGML